jgi:hypothetical protein
LKAQSKKIKIKDVDKLYSDLKRTKIQKNKKRERQFSKA